MEFVSLYQGTVHHKRENVASILNSKTKISSIKVGQTILRQTRGSYQSQFNLALPQNKF
jgi:hypothetical protein